MKIKFENWKAWKTKETKETVETKAQRILILGFEGSGRKTIMKSISKRKIILEDNVFITTLQLKCCEEDLSLYSINPSRLPASSLKPILNVATCAILLVNGSDSKATVRLESLIEYCSGNNIESITIGIWSSNTENQLFDEESAHQFLQQKNLNVPIIPIYEDNTDDINNLLEVTCIKATVDDYNVTDKLEKTLVS